MINRINQKDPSQNSHTSLDAKNGYIGDAISLSLEASDSLTFVSLLGLILKDIPFISGFVKLSLRIFRTLAYFIRLAMNFNRKDEDRFTDIAAQSRLENDAGWLILNIIGLTFFGVGLLLSGPFAILLGSSFHDILELYNDVTHGTDDSSTGFGYIWDTCRDFSRDCNQRNLYNAERREALTDGNLNTDRFKWLDQKTKVNLATNGILAIGKMGSAIITIIALGLGFFPPALIITAITLSTIIILARLTGLIYNKCIYKPPKVAPLNLSSQSLERQMSAAEAPAPLAINIPSPIEPNPTPSPASSSLANHTPTAQKDRARADVLIETHTLNLPAQTPAFPLNPQSYFKDKKLIRSSSFTSLKKGKEETHPLSCSKSFTFFPKDDTKKTTPPISEKPDLKNSI